MDKLEAVLPGSGSWSRAFEEIRGEFRHTNPAVQFRKSKDYAAVIDMRPVLGVDAMVHFESRFRGDHKIEILDSGEKSFDQCVDIIATITDEHPLPLEVRRVDLCANTPGVPVSWYASTVRAQWKQFEAKLGTVEMLDGDGRTLQWAEMGKRVLQTIYLGKRPNCFRIYDKTAEQYLRWQQAARAHKRGLTADYFELLKVRGETAEAVPAAVMARLQAENPFPSFEVWSDGLTRSTVLTRVEREIAGGRVPAKLDRVYKLKQELREFNPFTRLKGFGGEVGPDELNPDRWSPRDYAAGMWFRQAVESGEWTYQDYYWFINRDRNGADTEKKFRPFLNAALGKDRTAVSAQQLYDNYRETVSRQLAA